MAFRSNPRPKFMGPSPWLQGAPPTSLLPNPMQGQGTMMNQGPRQGMGYNPIVSQLALANNLLSSALNKNQAGFGGPGGRGILGSAPQHFQSGGGPGMMRNMMMQGGPDPKRLRMGPGNPGMPPGFNPRPRMPFNTPNRPPNRVQPQPAFNRDRNQLRPLGKRTRWEEEKNKKPKETSPEKTKETNSTTESEKEKSSEDHVMSSGDEKTYDPSSPTSDVELKDNEETANHSNASQETDSADTKDNDAQGILQVTIQKGMKGRSVCKEGESGAASQGPMFCHVCNVSCSNLENFHKHMNSKNHKVKMDSLITLHEAKTKQLEARMKASDQLHKIEEKERGKGSYCNICKSSYTGSAILHQRTSEHKKQKELMYTYCQQCNINHFSSREEYEEHCKTEEHAKALEDWKKEHGNEAACDWEDVDDPDEGKGHKEQAVADTEEEDIDPCNIPPYNPDKPIGRSRVVPLSGLFCKVCRKFYKDQESADKHCQSKPHYDNFKKSLAAAANFQKLKEKRDLERLEEMKPQKEEEKEKCTQNNVSQEDEQTVDTVAVKEDVAKDGDKDQGTEHVLDTKTDISELKGNQNQNEEADSAQNCSASAESTDAEIVDKDAAKPKTPVVKKTPPRGRGRGKK